MEDFYGSPHFCNEQRFHTAQYGPSYRPRSWQRHDGDQNHGDGQQHPSLNSPPGKPLAPAEDVRGSPQTQIAVLVHCEYSITM